MDGGNQCHGCGGKGWVDTKTYGAVKCPICGGVGVAPTKWASGYIEPKEEVKKDEKSENE